MNVVEWEFMMGWGAYLWCCMYVYSLITACGNTCDRWLDSAESKEAVLYIISVNAAPAGCRPANLVVERALPVGISISWINPASEIERCDGERVLLMLNEFNSSRSSD